MFCVFPSSRQRAFTIFLGLLVLVSVMLVSLRSQDQSSNQLVTVGQWCRSDGEQRDLSLVSGAIHRETVFLVSVYSSSIMNAEFIFSTSEHGSSRVHLPTSALRSRLSASCAKSRRLSELHRGTRPPFRKRCAHI